MVAPSNSCDILIVGGGPAGSTCASRLREYGFDVLIVDKARFPRDKVCAGWITPQVVESLSLDLDEYDQHAVLQPITGFRVGLIDRPTIQIDYDSIVSYGICRREFDEFLLRRSGVPIIEGEAVESIERQRDGWLINSRIQASVVIGAGGHFCPIARWLREHQPKDAGSSDPPTPDTIVAAQEVEYAMTRAEAAVCGIDPCIPELYFFADLGGYAWCFRKEQYLNIGLGRVGERHLGQRRDQLLDWLVSTGRIGSRPSQRFKGHAYRLDIGPRSPIVDDGLLLIGDAAGLAGAQSGEGIRPAIESGLAAADVLAADRSHFDRSTLQCYADRLDRQLGPAAWQTTGGFLSVIRRSIGGWLLTQRWFVRRVVLDDWFLNRTRSGEN